MNRRLPRWQGFVPRPNLSPELRSWLLEPGSLTQRGLRTFGRFGVTPVFQGWAPQRDQLGARFYQHAYVREVILRADTAPFIVAHTVLEVHGHHGPLKRWLRGLGSRSLGSLLFQHPGFQRGRLQFARLDARDALYQLCREQIPNLPPQCWARRCTHRLGKQAVRVTEIFVSLA